MKNLIRLFSFLLLSVYLTSCDSDENEVIPLGPTIFEIASDTENLSTSTGIRNYRIRSGLDYLDVYRFSTHNDDSLSS